MFRPLLSLAFVFPMLAGCDLEGHVKGIAELESHEYENAIATFTQIIDSDPEDTNAHCLRGLAYEHSGQHDMAMSDFDAAIAIDATFANAYSCRGLVHLSQKNYGKAIEDCDQAISIDPQLADAYLHRGRAHLKNGDSALAAEDFAKAIRLIPNRIATLNNSGNHWVGAGDYDKAMECYSRAIEEAPEERTLYFNRGLAHFRQESFESAQKDFQKAKDLGDTTAQDYTDYRSAYSKETQPVDIEARSQYFIDSSHWTLSGWLVAGAIIAIIGFMMGYAAYMRP